METKAPAAVRGPGRRWLDLAGREVAVFWGWEVVMEMRRGEGTEIQSEIVFRSGWWVRCRGRGAKKATGVIYTVD